MNLVIPDDILTASGMTEAELKLEIAIILYK
jgi:predicted HTH domain antitoxin